VNLNVGKRNASQFRIRYDFHSRSCGTIRNVEAELVANTLLKSNTKTKDHTVNFRHISGNIYVLDCVMSIKNVPQPHKKKHMLLSLALYCQRGLFRSYYCMVKYAEVT